MPKTIDATCPKRYEINGRVERCVKGIGHESPCQLNCWWAVKVPELELNIGTSLESSVFTIRRVE